MTIDIMMPFYGDVLQFKEAVSSVLAQTQPGWRLVVVDDRYPDSEPARWLASLDDSRVEYVLNETNLGVAGNFQRCIELARAEHVVIMGCDDVMLPRYVERVGELIAAYPTSAYIQPGVDVIDASGARILPLADRVKAWFRPTGHTPRELGGETLETSLLHGNWTYFPSLCWNRAAIARHGFRLDYRIVLDLALQLALIEEGGALVLDDEVVFRYRRHASVSSWSGSGAQRFAEEKALFAEARRNAIERGWKRAARAAAWHLTSRLNGLAQLPAALRTPGGASAVLRHAIER